MYLVIVFYTGIDFNKIWSDKNCILLIKKLIKNCNLSSSFINFLQNRLAAYSYRIAIHEAILNSCD